MGYPVGYKGYKLGNLQSKQFFISQDVRFHEHIYPFRLVPSSAPLMDPFADLAIPLPQPDISAIPPQQPLNPPFSTKQSELPHWRQAMHEELQAMDDN